MWEPEDWFMAFFVGVFILLSLLYMWADTTYSKQYEDTCTKAGGTSVFNGEFRECFGVKSKGE